MNKSTAYRQTFREHRRLLSFPVVLALVISLWAVMGSPKSYMATTSLWVDNAAPGDSSLANVNPALTPPAQQEQSVIVELLATRSFALAVGHRSLLAPYLASGPQAGFGPSALLSKLSGTQPLDAQIVAAVGPSVSTTVAGPQVLQVSYVGPTAAVAASALRALVAQLQSQSASFAREHGQQAAAYYQVQVNSAAQALAAARQQVNAYLAHGRTASPTNPSYVALSTAVGAASSQLTQANQRYRAAIAAAHDSLSGSVVSVIDPALAPPSPSSGKKAELMGVLGGIFAGGLISFLGVLVLTKRREAEPWEDELDAAPSFDFEDAFNPIDDVDGQGSHDVDPGDPNPAEERLVDAHAIGRVREP